MILTNMDVYDLGVKAVKKHNSSLLAVYIKELGFFAFMYGGTAIFTKHWG